MSVDLVVIHSPVGGGHKAAASAIVEAARARGLGAHLLDTFEHAPKVVGRGYVTAHLTGQSAAPNLYGEAYFAANRRDGALEPVRRAVDHVVFSALVDRVLTLRPGAVIATHHLPLVVLGRARRHGWLQAPLVGVITDYTAHAVWAERGVDAFCVPCPRAAAELAAHGVPRERVTQTGIPVRAAFERTPDVRAPRPGEKLRVLLTSGGFGVGPMRAVVRSFAGMRDVRLTVVCGNAPGVVARVRALAATLEIDAEVVGFERDMPSRIADAHVVVGKAGGLTVSEAMTAGRPMVIVGAVPGNETLNAELVTAAGAGYCAAPERAGQAAAWIRQSGALAAMGARARSLVVHDAASRVIEVARREAWRLADRHAA